jgi:hypothetical protein
LGLGGYHSFILMKSTVVCLVLGLAAAVGCGGESGARSDGDATGGTSATAGTSALAGTGNVPVTTAGTASMAGSVSTAGTATTGGMGGTGTVSTPCGPNWAAGTMYAEGAIVKFSDGNYYIAEHENPGYDPTISTYFWNPYTCDSDGGGSGGTGIIGTGGTGPVGESAFDDLVSEQVFNQLFPNRNPFYTYQGLVEATRHYPMFTADGTPEQKKREAAAFLANVARETGELIYIDQIEKDVYCMPSANCPCEPGKSYYGRGPIQISWNYNYCTASASIGVDIRARPELVSQDATIAWETGLWFWMTQRGAGNYTPHVAIVENRGFGETIRSINGSVECDGKSPEGVQSRNEFFRRYCEVLGVSPGDNTTC